MNLLKALFGGNIETPEEKQKADEAKRFDMFKYDGMRAAKIGQYDFAVKCLEEALAIRDDMEARQHLAQALVRIDKADEALVQLQAVAQAAPDDGATQRQIAAVAHLTENYDAMETACQRALEIDANDHGALYLAALASNGRGDKVGAIARLTKALTIKNDYAEARLLRGQTILGLGDTASADEDATWLADNLPDNEDALMLKARVCRAKGETKEAIGMYGRAIDCNPFCADAYRERGALRYELGDMTGAQDDAAKVVELAPESVEGVSGDFTAEGVEHKTRQAFSNLNPLGI